MARYIVDSQIDNHEKYYFIREQESQDIVLLPSKYLMHKKRSKLSPNTIRRSAGAISYYLNYIDETGIQLDDVWSSLYVLFPVDIHEMYSDIMFFLLPLNYVQ